MIQSDSPKDGPIRNMRVEDLHHEGDRTFITYSYSTPRPLDNMHITLHKPTNVTWAEFKESITSLCVAMENQEYEIAQYETIELSAVEDMRLLLEQDGLTITPKDETTEEEEELE